MAGLCGVVALKEGLDVVGLNQRLVSRLRHRGPDGVHQWSGTGASISYLALHVQQGVRVAGQPMRLSDGRICVVDGFVSDPQALLRALDVEAGDSTPSDAQCIAMVIERWDVEFWRHVDGDFAVAVFDPASRILQLTRDHLGVRPMFHVRTADLLAFCSEPEPLFALPGVDGRIRDATVAEVWTQLPFPHRGWADKQGVVTALPAAHRVSLDGRATTTAERYWQLAPRPPLQLADEREYVEAFREVFSRAVASATRDTGSSALMLSGGIDSGAILAAARGFKKDASTSGLFCISAVTDDNTTDAGFAAETANIKTLLKTEADTDTFTVPIQAWTAEPIEAADAAEVAWSYRHPVDASIYIPSLVGRVARQRGTRVVLNGVGGDLVSASPNNYVGRLVLQGHWRGGLREANAASSVHTYLQGVSPARILAKSVLAELQPATLRRFRARRALAADLIGIRSSGLAPDFIRSAGIEALYASGLEQRIAASERPAEERRCQTMVAGLDIGFRGFNQVIARQGVEARDPWSSVKVVQFFLALPLEWRVRHGWTKYLVRRSCEEALGHGVAWHSGKRHHGPLVTRQLVVDAAPFLRRYLQEVRPTLALFLNATLLNDADRLLANPEALSHPQADSINALVTLSGWLTRQGSVRHSR